VEQLPYGSLFHLSFSLLAGGLWVFLSRKTPENAEFAIAGAISWTPTKIDLGRVTKRGRGGGGSERKTACPKTRLL